MMVDAAIRISLRCLTVLAGCTTGLLCSTVAATEPDVAQLRFFENKIRPLLAEYCYDCHGAETQESELRLDTWNGMRAGGLAGPAIAPGKPAGSLLITAVRYQDNDLRMPPDEKLSKAQIADLAHWIEQGAPHPDSDNAPVTSPRATVDIEAGRRHWAFQPLPRPVVPANASQATSPIDAFITAQLQAAQIQPLPRADKRTLIRRATFDLTGLPPTPAEIQAFLADESASAFERLIDRLLASHAYGQRWGRHWLDIARYADSNGLDENVAHGNAWRYRDYVVRSLNQDKPYDQFVTEQLAGDLLPADTTAQRHEQLIATGYLSLGPKVLAEVDGAKMEMDIVDEQLDTVGRSLIGLTLGCARCHDHKFDPIGQDDYYALAGIFKSTRTMETFQKVAKWHENEIATAEDLARKDAHQQQIDRKQQQIDELVSRATDDLLASDASAATGDASAKIDEKQFSADVQQQLKGLRDQLKQLQESKPVMPSAMGVTEGEIQDTSIHLRGSHLTLGDTVERRFPRVMAQAAPTIPPDRSGRLAMARWLTSPQHPLTARVIVNRLWRWHFGKGLVATVDNFGLQGSPPSHPELLDYLAWRLIDQGWSLKAMHREIMLSQTYQRSSGFDAALAASDPDNRLYWRFDVRRLEAEAIRDALLAVAGTLDDRLGGSLLQTGNREYLFNHTSEDKSTYDGIRRRSIYVPVIRNHLYDFFQLFDYTDASVMSGNRDTSTIAPQALLLMNSQFVDDRADDLARRVQRAHEAQAERIEYLFELVYGRPPAETERTQAATFLDGFAASSTASDASQQAWAALCQAVLSTNEFVYLR